MNGEQVVRGEESGQKKEKKKEKEVEEENTKMKSS